MEIAFLQNENTAWKILSTMDKIERSLILDLVVLGKTRSHIILVESYSLTSVTFSSNQVYTSDI